MDCMGKSWVHGQQHGHMHACADTVVDDYHWGPTQSVLQFSFGKAAQQVSKEEQHMCWKRGFRHTRCLAVWAGSTAALFFTCCSANLLSCHHAPPPGRQMPRRTIPHAT